MDQRDQTGDVAIRDGYARALGQRLRRVRVQQRRSLQDVEDASGGRLKASVVGAYERGERSVSITRLQALADHYRVPVQELLPGGDDRPPADESRRLTIDLIALEERRSEVPVLARYVAAIQSRRGDYNGAVLTVRAADLEALAAALEDRPHQLRARLEHAGLLV